MINENDIINAIGEVTYTKPLYDFNSSDIEL